MSSQAPDDRPAQETTSPKTAYLALRSLLIPAARDHYDRNRDAGSSACAKEWNGAATLLTLVADLIDELPPGRQQHTTGDLCLLLEVMDGRGDPSGVYGELLKLLKMVARGDLGPSQDGGAWADLVQHAQTRAAELAARSPGEEWDFVVEPLNKIAAALSGPKASSAKAREVPQLLAALAAAEVKAAKLSRANPAWTNVHNCMRAMRGVAGDLPSPPWSAAHLLYLFRLTADANQASVIDGKLVLVVMANAVGTTFPDCLDGFEHEELVGAAWRLQALLLLSVTEKLSTLPEPVAVDSPGQTKRGYGLRGGGGLLHVISDQDAEELLLLRSTLVQVKGVLAADLASLVLRHAPAAELPEAWRAPTELGDPAAGHDVDPETKRCTRCKLGEGELYKGFTLVQCAGSPGVAARGAG